MSRLWMSALAAFVVIGMMDVPGPRAIALPDSFPEGAQRASAARLVFVTYALGLPQARKVEVLVDSIRTFAGPYAAAPVYVASDAAASAALSRSAQTAVHVVPVAMPEIAADVPLAVKAYAAAQVEAMLPSNVDTMLWMDPETVVLSPPLGLALEAPHAVALQPVFLLNRVGLPPEQRVDGYWSRIYREAGVETSTLPTLQASADRRAVRFYINCGVIAYRPAKRLCAEWARALTAVLSDTTYRREHVSDSLHALFLHQAVLSAVIAARTSPGERRWIPIDHGYPLGQHERLPAERRVKRLNQVACLIYDQVWDTNPQWMSVIPADEPLRAWLKSAYSRTVMPEPLAPGVEPEVFAPGVVSTDAGVEFCGSPAPDGREFYFTVRRQSRTWEIRFVRRNGSGWSAPRVASFSGQFSDLEPFVTSDGSQILFSSNRPVSAGGAVRHYAIWIADRTASDWSAPRLVEELDLGRDAWRPTASRAGNIYFSSNGLWRAQRTGARFAHPEIVSRQSDAPPAGHACISPDETVMITSAMEGQGARGGWDLYVSFRNADGTWAPSRNLGPLVNTAAHEDFGCISPDGRAFFFTRLQARPGAEADRADIYWVRADFLQALRQP